MELTAEAEDALVSLHVVRQGLMSEAKLERAVARAAAASRRLVDHLAAEGALGRDQLNALRTGLDPEVVPGYRIEGEAGRGGMGVVYRARQVSMDRPVALKILSRSLSEDASYVAKFLAEARSAARLNHENVVAAIDAGEQDGLYYFVMELIDGPSVADLLADGPLPWERAFAIAEQVARGLRHAHDVGIVHRDVKPENVMLAADQTVKLCDLGLAKPLQKAGTGEKEAMTEGTPYYCSPEQALGRTDIDARSDVYSLGATLFHMLTGAPPFDGDSARAILVKHVKTPFPDLEAALPEVPAPLRELLGAMVVKEREDRLSDMRAFEERLAAARQGPRAASGTHAATGAGGGRGSLVAAGAALAVAVVALALAPWGSAHPTSEPAQADPPAAVEPTPDAVDPAEGEEPPAVVVESSPGDQALAQAAAYRAAHPEDVWGAEARYRALVADDPTASVAEVARLALAELEAEGARRGKEALDRLATQVLELTQQRRFRTALELCDSFRTTWAPREVPGLDARVAVIAGAAGRGASAAATQALAALSGATPGGAEEQAVLALAKELPQADAERVRIEVAGWLAEQRRVRWQAKLSRYRAALYAGDVAAAATIVEGVRPDEAIGPTAAELRAELDGVRKAGEVFTGTWLALTGTEVELGFAVGGRRRGRLVRFDPQSWAAELDCGGEERVRFDLRELDPVELAQRGLPPRDGRLNALFFLGRGAPAAAAAALAVGGADDPPLRRAIEERSRAAAEQLSAAWLERWTAGSAAAAARIDAIRAVPEAVRRSHAYRERFAEVVAAYRAAREEQLRADPGSLFAGAVDEGRRGRVTVTYDFAQVEQLRDWAPDTVADPTSRIEPADDGGCDDRGKVNLFARFDDGELKVEVRAVPLAPERPNVAVVLCSGSGWRGVLCAAGYAPPNVLNVLALAKGARRPAEVPLPAHLVAELDGRLPGEADSILDSAACAAPRPGEEVRLSVQRSTRGSLRVKADARTLSLRGVDAAERPGLVALAPLDAGVRVLSVELTGTLDAAWLERAPAEVAAREAASLPRPLP